MTKILSADPSGAVAQYLSTELEAATGGNVSEGLRIFRPDLPKTEDEYMPNACVVVVPGGGSALQGKDYLPMATSLLDCFCYGDTHLQADILARRVGIALKQIKRHVVKYALPEGAEEVCLNWARIVAEPKTMVDQETLWPIALITSQISYFTTPI